MSLISDLRCYLGKHKTRVLRKLGLKGGDWRTGLADETDFWARALAHEGRDWNRSEYTERMDPQFPLQPELRELIDAPEGTTVRILDVGSGPLTRVGRIWEGRSVEITAVDPLAEEYLRVIAQLGLKVPVLPRHAEGETLREQFAEDSFDLAYASNCLDHSYAPLTAIREMLAVVKPGSYAYLWHFPNAGLHERYTGLHQWNFDECDGDMTINDGRSARSLREELGKCGEVRCVRGFAFNTTVIVTRVRKLATPPLAAV